MKEEIIAELTKTRYRWTGEPYNFIDSFEKRWSIWRIPDMYNFMTWLIKKNQNESS